MYDYFGYMYVCVLHVCLVPEKSKEGFRTPDTDTGGIDVCEEPCGSWESNLGSLEGQPSSQPLSSFSSAVPFDHLSRIITVSYRTKKEHLPNLKS